MELAFILRYWKQITMAVVIFIAVAVLWWLRGALDEREELRQQVKDAAATQQTQAKINEVHDETNKESAANVQRIQNAPKPRAHGVLVPGGVQQAVPASHSAH